MNQFRKLVREAHRRSLWQVLGIYAVASWIIYQVVLALFEGLGLPDWVPGTAVVLLLLGLPVVLATAFIQEGGPARASGGTDDAAPAEPAAAPAEADRRGEAATPAVAAADRGAAAEPPGGSGARRALFTWPRAITFGVLAFAGLGLAASGFMGMRALGIGPAATLVSAGVLEEREPVLLAEFGSASGDSVLAAAVTEALRVDLESSPVVRLVPTSQVQDALRRMRREPAAAVTEALARELALREGIRAVLVGEVTTAGGQVVVSARLIGPDGASLASVRHAAAPDAVIEAADRVSAGIRERLGESLRSIRRAEPLAQVTTPSLGALRAYSQALRAYDTESDARKSIVLLQEALSDDSAFAMAWRKLGVAYQYVSQDSMRLALEHAFRHRDRLSERERYLTEGTYYDIVAADTARAVVAYETVLDLHPDEFTALHNLARLNSMRGNLERAEALYGRALELNPTSAVTMRNRAYILGGLKRYDELEQLLDQYASVHPDHHQVPQFQAGLASARFDYAAAVPLFERAREMGQDINDGLRSILLVQGRHAEAHRSLREDLREAELSPEARERQMLFQDVVTLAFHRGDPAAALDRLARAVPDSRMAVIPAADRPYFMWGMLHVLAGDAAAAEAILKRWRQARPEDFDPLDGDALGLSLEIDAVRGDTDELIRLRRREAGEDCLDCWYHLGRAHEMAGNADSAIAAYETYLDPPRPPLFRVTVDRWWLPATLQRLAALHEEAGNGDRAAAHYARFVELWKDADPELRPQVEAARSALTRLAVEGSG